MDKERYELEKKDEKLQEIASKLKFDPENPPKNINYRLLQEYEVPNWIHVEIIDNKESDMKEYGKGMRSRQRINYRDENDDFQEDPNDEDDGSELKRKRKRNMENITKKKKTDNDSENDKSSYINIDDEEYNDYSKSFSGKNNNKTSGTKMRIKLTNSTSNLKIGELFLI